MFHTKVVANQNTYIISHNFFYCAIYEITWKKYCRAVQTRDGNMAHAHATNTH